MDGGTLHELLSIYYTVGTLNSYAPRMTTFVLRISQYICQRHKDYYKDVLDIEIYKYAHITSDSAYNTFTLVASIYTNT